MCLLINSLYLWSFLPRCKLPVNFPDCFQQTEGFSSVVVLVDSFLLRFVVLDWKCVEGTDNLG